MRSTDMILMSDFYKQSHAEQYPKGITKLISYATARMTRIPTEMLGDKLTVFGIQSYVKDFLIERFNETFFNVSLEEAMGLYNDIIGATFPLAYVNTGKFEALHKLGYLPVEIGCLPEGTRVPIRSAFELPEGQCQVPFMYIVNTHPDFPWVTEFLESVTSSEIWYPMNIANQAYYYRTIVNKWFDLTGCDKNAAKSAISEFGFRGGKGSGAANLASAAFLTSFNKTATIPAIKYLHDYYGDDYKDIAGGMISTEHSVMCSNKAVDYAEIYDNAILVSDDAANLYEGDIFYTPVELNSNPDDIKFRVVLGSNNSKVESMFPLVPGSELFVKTSNGSKWSKQIDVEAIFLKRLFTEIYPSGALSVVCDSWDYWNCVENIIGKELKQDVMARNGCLFVRGDSGDPVDIICGTHSWIDGNNIDELIGKCNIIFQNDVIKEGLYNIDTKQVTEKFLENDRQMYCLDYHCRTADLSYYKVRMTLHRDSKIATDYVQYKPACEEFGTVELLWNIFGGTVNDKGFKILDSHVRAIYGDSITPRRAEEIYRRLWDKGFAACNVALGAGSFSTQCVETFDGKLLPFTRDSYGIAVKATWCANEDAGTEYELFKNPKTDTGKFKKSQRGMIYVTKDEHGEIIAFDGYTSDTIPKSGNMLQPIFRDGEMLSEVTLNDVRQRLHNNNF